MSAHRVVFSNFETFCSPFFASSLHLQSLLSLLPMAEEMETQVADTVPEAAAASSEPGMASHAEAHPDEKKTPNLQREETRGCQWRFREFEKTAPGRVRGKQFSCRHCLTLQTMLYRNLGPVSQQQWSEGARKSFFKKAGEKDLAGHGWPVVRSLLVEILTIEHIDSKGSKVEAKSLPLKVWMAKGWEESVVTQYPAEKCEKRGQLYAVPVRSDVWKKQPQATP